MGEHIVLARSVLLKRWSALLCIILTAAAVTAAVCLCFVPQRPPLELHGLVPRMRTERMIRASRTGDWSMLSDTEGAVLLRAQEAASDCVRVAGTDPQRLARAAHDWLIVNTTYDDTHLSDIGMTPDRSSTPEGTLLNGRAICYGYASTYQLLLGLMDIPCDVVYGWNAAGKPHAWNRLAGGYVDVCWDDTQNSTDNWMQPLSAFEETGHIFPALTAPGIGADAETAPYTGT